MEGVIDMKLSSKAGAGTMRVAVSKVGARSEVALDATPMKLVMVVKHANPDTLFFLDDSQKTYSEMDLKRMREQAAAQQSGPPPKYAVKKLGRDKVAGFSCVRVQVTNDREPDSQEMCLSKDVHDFSTFARTQRQGSPAGGAALEKALKDAGAEGFPVRFIQKRGNDVVMSMEVVKVDKKAVPASTFDVPAGYKKTEGFMGGMGGPPPGAVQEMMKNMTPEQREQMRKMMEGQKAGPGSPGKK
jgi:hypothetical protein